MQTLDGQFALCPAAMECPGINILPEWFMDVSKIINFGPNYLTSEVQIAAEPNTCFSLKSDLSKVMRPQSENTTMTRWWNEVGRIS